MPFGLEEERYGHGQILGVGDLLLVQAESGDVAVVEATPSELRKLGRFAAIEGKTWSKPLPLQAASARVEF